MTMKNQIVAAGRITKGAIRDLKEPRQLLKAAAAFFGTMTVIGMFLTFWSYESPFWAFVFTGISSCILYLGGYSIYLCWFE